MRYHAAMVTTEIIAADSPHLDAVKALWRANSDTLGFLPAGAFADYARDRHILVALLENRCVGYLLYRIVRGRVTIAHFCVDAAVRNQGIARAMLDQLIAITQQHRGIVLSCRRDFAVNRLWPRLGFHAIGRLPGRAASGSELDRWALDYMNRDLFSGDDESTGMDAAIDANIFLDLADGAHEETQWLLADWLQPLVTLCYTNELLTDLNRNADEATRRRRLAEVQQYKLLQCSAEAFRKSDALLRPLFPAFTTEQDESDFRHLVRAHAAEADVFVTRDDKLLSRADEVFEACRLRVVRPAELIGQIDVIENEREYHRDLVAGTREVFHERVSAVDDALIDCIQAHGEQGRKLEAELNKYLAAPQRSACHKILDRDGGTLAVYVVERDAQVERVPILRICAKRQAGTLARAVLTGIIRKAVAAGSTAVFIAEREVTETLQAACADLGFLTVANGRVKLIVRGWVSTDEAAAQLTWADPNVDELRSVLATARTDESVAARIEHLIWPGKLSDAPLPCFIVPIRAEFAEQLFDERLARGGLFGADVDLALNPESAYYRAARPSILRSPARVLWYVSASDVFDGAMAIRACSRIVELECDTPKRLFSRFRRLGVYEWQHVVATADGNLDKEIMAFRFDDTELLPPIAWQRFQAILAANGITNNLQSPAEIPPAVFGQIYAAALDPSAAR